MWWRANGISRSLFGQKPWWNWFLAPVVNFGEVRRAKLAKCALLTYTWCPWDLFRSFKVCSYVKRLWGAESYCTYSSLVKLQPWFLSLQGKICPSAEHSDDILDYIKLHYYIYCIILYRVIYILRSRQQTAVSCGLIWPACCFTGLQTAAARRQSLRFSVTVIPVILWRYLSM